MEKITVKNLKNSGIEMLSRQELIKISGGEDECALGTYKMVTYELNGIPLQWDCVEVYGIPGGNNGNPCPTLCEPTGGRIMCLGVRDNVNHVHSGNCNSLTPTQSAGLHNACAQSATGSFWC